MRRFSSIELSLYFCSFVMSFFLDHCKRFPFNYIGFVFLIWCGKWSAKECRSLGPKAFSKTVRSPKNVRVQSRLIELKECWKFRKFESWLSVSSARGVYSSASKAVTQSLLLELRDRLQFSWRVSAFTAGPIWITACLILFITFASTFFQFQSEFKTSFVKNSTLW